MSDKVQSVHPVFDPTSLYSRLRASVRPEHKMMGYFHWLQARAKRAGATLPPRPAWSAKELSWHSTVVRSYTQGVSALAGLPGGRFATGGQDGTVRIWDLEGKVHLVLSGHDGAVRVLTVLDGDRLASAGAWDGTVRVWNLSSGQSEVIGRPAGNARDLAVLPDGRLVLAGADGGVRVWSPKARPEVIWEHEGAALALAVLPDGQVASFGGDWAVNKGGLDGREPEINWAQRSCWDGEFDNALANYRTILRCVVDDFDLDIGSEDGPRTFSSCVRHWSGQFGPCSMMAVLKRGLVARVDEKRFDSTIFVYGLGKALPLRGNPSRATALIDLPNGQLVSAHYDDSVWVWDLDSGAGRVVGQHEPLGTVTDALPATVFGVWGGKEQRSSPWPTWLARSTAVVVPDWGGKHSFSLTVPWQGKPEANTCRAFLFEPEVIARLEKALKTSTTEAESTIPTPGSIVETLCTSAAETILAQAFQPEVVTSNAEVARILSAVADVDGSWSDVSNTWRFERLPLPEGVTAFPPRDQPLHVVMVFH